MSPIERVGAIDRGGARTDNPGDIVPNSSITDFKQLADSNAPAAADVNARNPIGVPVGYGADYGEHGNIFDPNYTPTQPPRYFVGDELLPSNYPVERRIAMQQDLYEAGLLDTYRKGEWDTTTISAYKSALARANASGTTYNDSITQLKANVAQYGRPKDDRKLQPGVLELTNPTQIQNLASEVAVRTLGRRLAPEESARFAQTYNQMEREYQQKVYQLRLQGADNTIAGEVTQPQSLSDYGTDIGRQLKESNPSEASAKTTLNAADIFFSMLKSNR